MKKSLGLLIIFLIALLGFPGCTKVSDEQKAQEVVKDYVMDLYNVEQNDKYFELYKHTSTMTPEQRSKKLVEYLSTFKKHFTEKGYMQFVTNRTMLLYRNENITVQFKNIEYKNVQYKKERNKISIDCNITFDVKILDKNETEKLHDRRIIELVEESGKWKITNERFFKNQKLFDIRSNDRN